MTLSLGMDNEVLKMIGYGLKNRGSIPDRDSCVTPTPRPVRGTIQHTVQRIPTAHTPIADHPPPFTILICVIDI